MTFKYRYVNFGTNFSSLPGTRSAEKGKGQPEILYENELAVDTGGVCWGYGNENQSVMDHHFRRHGQFPSASAAVLHSAHRIQDKYAKSASDVIWLVTHREPDFDALCSMYLARKLIEDVNRSIDWKSFGLHPDGWLDITSDPPSPDDTVPRIDWFDPDLRRIPKQERWRILLAANASCVDNSRRLHCPKHRALHSVLYAALKRGRDYVNEDSGALEFFEQVREAIESKDLNPLFDSVLEGNSLFAPELAMLDRELEAYKRDVHRARKALVHLQRSDVAFAEFFDLLKQTALLKQGPGPTAGGRAQERTALTADPVHVSPPHQSRSQTDGIYIKDPECLLFKEWARLDIENSSMGEGFLFTAVAYSNGRPDGSINKTDYFFAVDPEKANRRHLYTVWARLQWAETESFYEAAHAALRQQLEQAEQHASNTSKPTNCRKGFEDRAGAYKALFDDPWFDGNNYECTIVATPNRGTLIGKPGTRGDLLDDPVATIVQSELEHSIYISDSPTELPKVTVVDLSASGNQKNSEQSHHGEARRYSIEDPARTVPPPLPGCFRFGEIRLNVHLDLLSGGMAPQIGETLWQVLHPDGGKGTPTDFRERHLLISKDWIGVWSRRGIVIAYKDAADDAAKILVRRFRDLAFLAQDVESFIHAVSGRIQDVVRIGDALTRRAAEIKHILTQPDNRILSRFFDARQLGEVLETLRDLNRKAAEQVRREMLDRQTKELTKHTKTVADVQTKVEWLEIFIVAFYATELMAIITGRLTGNDTGNHPVQLVLISFVGLIVLWIAAQMLEPWAHEGSKRPAWIVISLVILYFAALSLAMWYIFHSRRILALVAIGCVAFGWLALRKMLSSLWKSSGSQVHETGEK